MASGPLRLREGIDPVRAADVLRELISALNSVSGSASGPAMVERFRDAYLTWVERTEIQLRWMTHDPHPVDSLHTTRYWHIRELDMGSVRPWPLVDAEIETQRAMLQALLEDLNRRLQRARGASGHIAVLDTNVLLHYLPPDQIPWTAVLGRSAVRLVIPLRVVEELDAKKYARRSDLADRARRLLPMLESVIGTGDAPCALQPDVTIEIPLDSGSRIRPEDADEEILTTCDEFRAFSGPETTLVTGDTAMRLRAQMRQISVLTMPEAYRRGREKATE